MDALKKIELAILRNQLAVLSSAQEGEKGPLDFAERELEIAAIKVQLADFIEPLLEEAQIQHGLIRALQGFADAIKTNDRIYRPSDKTWWRKIPHRLTYILSRANKPRSLS